MLTKRYMASVKNLHSIMNKIVTGTAPEKFTVNHLKSIGFAGSNDRAIIGLLKDLGFLTEEGVPTPRYHEYRNPARSKQVLAEALREAYTDLFHINAKPTDGDRAAIEGVFKSKHNTTDRVAETQAMTFLGLLKLADMDHQQVHPKKDKHDEPKAETENKKLKTDGHPDVLQLRYNIEIHLPPTKDIEVYNSIFKSIKEHLID
jgi:Family of unknown function (DUF5343)